MYNVNVIGTINDYYHLNAYINNENLFSLGSGCTEIKKSSGDIICNQTHVKILLMISNAQSSNTLTKNYLM